jgi:superoxide dismutase
MFKKIFLTFALLGFLQTNAYATNTAGACSDVYVSHLNYTINHLKIANTYVSKVNPVVAKAYSDHIEYLTNILNDLKSVCIPVVPSKGYCTREVVDNINLHIKTVINHHEYLKKIHPQYSFFYDAWCNYVVSTLKNSIAWCNGSLSKFSYGADDSKGDLSDDSLKLERIMARLSKLSPTSRKYAKLQKKYKAIVANAS